MIEGTYTDRGIYLGIGKSRYSDHQVLRFQNMAKGITEIPTRLKDEVKILTEDEWNNRIDSRNYMMEKHFNSLPSYRMD